MNGGSRGEQPSRPVAQQDVSVGEISLDPRDFVETPTTVFVNGLRSVQGAWRSADEQLVGGYGIFGTSADASLVYQDDWPVNRMSIRVVITPDKATG